jgi:hypothetical protein
MIGAGHRDRCLIRPALAASRRVACAAQAAPAGNQKHFHQTSGHSGKPGGPCAVSARDQLVSKWPCSFHLFFLFLYLVLEEARPVIFTSCT